MVDGKMAVAKFGQGHYAPELRVFRAFVPAWRRGLDGNVVRSPVAIDDAWLRLTPNGPAILDDLRGSMYSADPQATNRRIIEALIRATRAQAKGRLALVDTYDHDVFIGPDDLDERSVRTNVFAPGYNDPARSHVGELLDRPLRGEVLLDDDLYRKTGLHAEAWRDTGRCALYQTHGVLTSRSRGHDPRPRFTLDQLEVVFDERWEEEVDVGRRAELVEVFGSYREKVLELDATGQLAEVLSVDVSASQEAWCVAASAAKMCEDVKVCG